MPFLFIHIYINNGSFTLMELTKFLTCLRLCWKYRIRFLLISSSDVRFALSWSLDELGVSPNKKYWASMVGICMVRCLNSLSTHSQPSNAAAWCMSVSRLIFFVLAFNALCIVAKSTLSDAIPNSSLELININRQSRVPNIWVRKQSISISLLSAGSILSASGWFDCNSWRLFRCSFAAKILNSTLSSRRSESFLEVNDNYNRFNFL